MWLQTHPAIAIPLLLICVISAGLLIALAQSVLRDAFVQQTQIAQANSNVAQQEDGIRIERAAQAATVARLHHEAQELIATINKKEDENAQLCRAVQQAQQEIIGVKRSHPEVLNIYYKIAMIGIVGSGKTVLAKKITDFTYLNEIELGPTKTAIYPRPISTIESADDQYIANHIFSIQEWGGEYLVRAQTDIVSTIQSELEEKEVERNRVKINEHERMQIGYKAIIFVVDLGDYVASAPDGQPRQSFSEERVREQVNDYFGRQTLRFFFDERVTKHCDLVVLFINKIDLIQYDEERAFALFRPLIETLKGLCRHMRFEFLAGSAHSDMGTRRLFSLLVRQVLSPADRDATMHSEGQYSDQRNAQNGAPKNGSLNGQSGLYSELTRRPQTAADAAADPDSRGS